MQSSSFYKSRTKQDGAIMMEAAYVLPIMLLMILLVVETVNYASDRLYANNIMTDMTRLITDQANDEAMRPGNQSHRFVSCSSESVVVNESEAATGLQELFAISIGNGTVPEGLEMTYEAKQTQGVTTYVVKVSIPSQTLFLPSYIAQSFPIKTNMLVSIDLSC